jgi:uncharacterized NAD(P)/FAD-binding protein YdhS
MAIGLDTDAEGRLVSTAGRASRVLYVLGAARRSESWESTAVPDIREQAAALARLLTDTTREARDQSQTPVGSHL